MFRAKTTRRNIKHALSPLKPALDPMNTATATAEAMTTTSATPTNVLLETLALASPPSFQSTAAAAVAEKQEKQMTDLFAAEAASVSLTKPWLRLERGIRMQKLRTFADNYEGLINTEDKENLYKYLVRANDTKLLNTKQQIQYEGGSINSIKGLKIILTGNPTAAATFKIDSVRGTKRNTSE